MILEAILTLGSLLTRERRTMVVTKTKIAFLALWPHTNTAP